ncbi:MAG: host attachment protein [Caulobacter sp.]|nr:host attachment protein [Caulobacter sp.]
MHPDGRTLVVAADAGHARIFEERRQGGRLIEHPEWLEAVTAGTGPRSSSGAVHDRMGQALHGTSARPAAEQLLDQFCGRLAARIITVFRTERFDGLALFAPPRALGRLREHLSPLIRSRSVLDAPLDLLAETSEGLRSRLRDIRFDVA